MSSSPSESFHRGLIEQRTKENVTVNVEPIKKVRCRHTVCKLMASNGLPGPLMEAQTQKAFAHSFRRNCVYILVCVHIGPPNNAFNHCQPSQCPRDRFQNAFRLPSLSLFLYSAVCLQSTAAPPHSLLLYIDTTPENNQHSFAYRTICIVVRGVRRIRSFL